MSDEVLDQEGAAAYLKVTKRQLYRLPIPCSRLSRKLRRYFKEDLVNYLKRKRMAA